MISHKKIIFLIFLTALTNCGKKRRNFFSYNKRNAKSHFNILTLPVIKGLYTKENTLQWKPIGDKRLVGYNIYRFAPGKVIRKKPLNNEALKENFLVDDINTKKHYYYIVKGVFTVNQKMLEGPSSKIIYK